MIVLIFASVLFACLLPIPLASTPSNSESGEFSQQAHHLCRTEPIPTRLDVALRAWFEEERYLHCGNHPCPGFHLETTTTNSVDRIRYLHAIAANDAVSSVSLVYTLCAILR
jgi:hypothetical protein